MGTDLRIQRQGALRSGQQGAVAIIFAASMLFIIALMGLALDLSRLFNRKVDLQVVADSTATAAARNLVGTPAGIDAARAAAAEAAGHQKFNYGSSNIPWSESALQFSASPKSGWMSGEAAKANPGAIMFARVDTATLDLGSLNTFFLNIISSNLATINTGAEAVAGRATMKVTPLGICAMSSTPASSRPPSGELVEYGFRRGVGYDLMQLNPDGPAPVNFLLNPIDTASSGESVATSVVGPFVCAGKMPSLGMVGGKVTAVRPFPIGMLFDHLNSRFGQYGGGACDFRSAPPDANVKSFVFSASSLWMLNTPLDQTATSMLSNGKLMTVADPVPHPVSNTAASYGQLWTFAKPVPFSAYVPGKPEPDAGYSTFSQSAWPALYAPGLPTPKSYPSPTPYMAFGAYATAPPAIYGKPVRYRRVLNVPLLQCPVGADAKATVLAIGKFFMTVPATPTSVRAEFAGIASEHTLRGEVELYK